MIGTEYIPLDVWLAQREEAPPEPEERLLPAARVEEINAALQELVERIYDPGWQACQADGRLAIGCPMGRHGAKAFGLTVTERDVLRVHLASKRRLQPRGPLLFFEETSRAWFVDLERYPTALHANAWLLRHGLHEWQYEEALRVVQARRKGDHDDG